MSPELIAYLLAWAVFYTGYPMPEEPPEIVYVTHQHFVDSPLCNGIDTPENPCDIRAAYNDNNSGIIEVDEKFKGMKGAHIKATIVHEMVHYLQDLSGHWKNMTELDDDMHCQERSYRQREAYMVQDKYAKDVYNIRRLLPRYYDRCGMR